MKKNWKLLVATLALGCTVLGGAVACGKKDKDDDTTSDVSIDSSIGDVDSSLDSSIDSSIGGGDSESGSEIVTPEIVVTLSQNSAELLVGESVTLIATIEGSEDQVTWSSDNETVATVMNNNGKGVVIANANGTANVTATVGGVTATCVVTVTSKTELVLNVEDTLNLDAGTWTDSTGATHGKMSENIVAELRVNNVPVEAEFTFKSSASQFVKVSDSGKVEVVKVAANGTAKADITVTCTYEGQTYEKKIAVNVNRFTVNSEKLLTFGGDPDQYHIDVRQFNLTPDDVVAIYIDDEDAKDFVVLTDGELLPDENGYFKVDPTVLDSDEQTAPTPIVIETATLRIEATVAYYSANNVKLICEISPMTVGSVKKYTLTLFGQPVTPEENPVWTSSEDHILEVSQDGVITAKAIGTSVITASLYGYEYSATQVVYTPETARINENPVTLWASEGVVSKIVHGYTIPTQGLYYAGDWVSFTITPAETISSGMLFAYYGHSNSNNYPTGMWYAGFGANTYQTNHYDDDTFIVLDSQGNRVGSIADGAGFGTLKANETYTVYMQIPDDGTENHDVYLTVVREELSAGAISILQNGDHNNQNGQIVWRDYFNDHAVSVTFANSKGYVYAGETRENVLTKEDSFKVNAGESLDLSAWDITQTILIAEIEGVSYDYFERDENGLPLFVDNKLVIANNFYTYSGTAGVKTLIIETEDYKYIAEIEILAPDAKFNEVKFYGRTSDAYTAYIVTGEEFKAKYEEGYRYITVDMYVYGEWDSSSEKKNFGYIELGQRHTYLVNNGAYLIGMDGGWQTAAVPTDYMRVYENGTLLNDNVMNASGGNATGNVTTANETLETGKWYTFVFNMDGKTADLDTIVKYNCGLCLKGQGNAQFYVTAPKFSFAPSTVTPTASADFLRVGETLTVNPNFNGADENNVLTWSSSNEEIATVVDGVVTGVTDGTVTITVTTKDGVSASITLQVKPAAADTAIVQFVLNGEVVYENLEAKRGEPIAEIEHPEYLSYAFNGWFAAGSDTAYDFTSNLAGDLVLTAKYTAVWYDDANEFKNESNMYFYRKPTLLMEQSSSVWTETEAGNEYFVFDMTIGSDFTDSDYVYMQLVGRHVSINANGINVGNAGFVSDVPADQLVAYNADGTVATTLEKGKTYCIVINITGVGATREWVANYLTQTGNSMTPAEWCDAYLQFAIAPTGNMLVSLDKVYGAMTKDEASELACPTASVTFKVGEDTIESKQAPLNQVIVAPTVDQYVSYSFAWYEEGSDTPFDLANTKLTGDLVLVGKYSAIWYDDANEFKNESNMYFYRKPTLLMEQASSIWTATEAGKEYFVFDMTIASDFTDTDYVYMQLVGRHAGITASGMTVGGNGFNDDIPADLFRAFDMDGVEVTTLEKGKTYRIVINITGVGATREWLANYLTTTGNPMTPAEWCDAYLQFAIAPTGNMLVSLDKVYGAMTKADADKLAARLVTVTFATEEGESTSQTIANGATVTAPEASNYSQYVSYELKWFLGDKEFDFATPITEDVTLTAKYVAIPWDATQTVKNESNIYWLRGDVVVQDGLTAMNKADAGEENYFVFDLTFHNDSYYTSHDDHNVLYVQIVSAHYHITKNGLGVGGRGGSSKALPADFFSVYDAAGNLVNNNVIGVNDDTAEKGELQQGVTYTVVLNLGGVGWDSINQLNGILGGAEGAAENWLNTASNRAYVSYSATGTLYCTVDSHGTMTADEADALVGAKKGAVVTVTFVDADGNSTTQEVEKNSTVTAPKLPDYVSYVEGWYADGSETAFDFATPITEDITLTAKYVYTADSDYGGVCTASTQETLEESVTLETSYVMKVTFAETIADDSGLLIILANRSYRLENWGLSFIQLKEPWYGNSAIPGEITKKSCDYQFELYDANGNLINSYLKTGSGLVMHEVEGETQELVAGETYTIVFNLGNNAAGAAFYDGSKGVQVAASNGAKVEVESLGCMTREEALALIAPEAEA